MWWKSPVDLHLFISCPHFTVLRFHRGWSLSQLSVSWERATHWTGCQAVTGLHRDEEDVKPSPTTSTSVDKFSRRSTSLVVVDRRRTTNQTLRRPLSFRQMNECLTTSSGFPWNFKRKRFFLTNLPDINTEKNRTKETQLIMWKSASLCVTVWHLLLTHPASSL